MDDKEQYPPEPMPSPMPGPPPREEDFEGYNDELGEYYNEYDAWEDKKNQYDNQIRINEIKQEMSDMMNEFNNGIKLDSFWNDFYDLSRELKQRNPSEAQEFIDSLLPDNNQYLRSSAGVQDADYGTVTIDGEDIKIVPNHYMVNGNKIDTYNSHEIEFDTENFFANLDVDDDLVVSLYRLLITD